MVKNDNFSAKMVKNLPKRPQIIPVAIAFGIPVVIAAIIVTARSSLKGELNVNQLARGDFK
jgi:hypothetical protein